MKKVKEGSIPSDKVTRLLGDKPSKEKILQIMKYKGITYQRKERKDIPQK